jgi:hypothetical protein
MIYCFGLTSIPFGHPKSEPRCVSADDINAVIGTPAIDDYVLDVRISLKQH